MLALMKGLKEPEAEDSPEAEAQEEVLNAGVPVIFSTSCGIVRDTRDRCQRARLLLSRSPRGMGSQEH